MQVDLLQEHRAIGDVGVDLGGRGHLGALPLELDDLHAQQPLVVGMRVGELLHALHHLLKAAAVDEVHRKIGIGHERALGKVRVRIDEAGSDELVAEVAHLGIGSDKGRQMQIVAARDDLAVAHRHASRKRERARAGKDSAGLDDEFRLFHMSLLALKTNTDRRGTRPRLLTYPGAPAPGYAVPV